jgi:hypothetical protein
MDRQLEPVGLSLHQLSREFLIAEETLSWIARDIYPDYTATGVSGNSG